MLVVDCFLQMQAVYKKQIV